jgi:LPS-assembly lipoprotein
MSSSDGMARGWRPAKHAPGRAAAVVTLLAALTGCGFHLRGDVAYPPAMARTYIEAADRYTPFYRKVRAALREGGVHVTDSPAGAGAVLHILEDESGQRVLSVSARNTPREFDVYYVVRYSLDIDGRQALPVQQLALNRDYTYDETLVLGKDAESELIRQALADDLVGVVTRRLSSVR